MDNISDGNIVKVSSKDNFEGLKLAYVMGKCKKCSGYNVRLLDEDAPVLNHCILPEKGDTIVKVSK